MWRIGSSICTFYIYSFWEARKQVNTNITRSRFEKERTKRINKNVCRHHRYQHYLDESWTPQGNIDIFTEGPGGILIPSMEGPGGRLHVGTSGLHIYVVYSKKQYFTEHHGWGNKTVLCKPVEKDSQVAQGPPSWLSCAGVRYVWAITLLICYFVALNLRYFATLFLYYIVTLLHC